MKKLVFIVVAFTIFFGQEFYTSENSPNKLPGVYFSVSNIWHQDDTINPATTIQDDTDNQPEIILTDSRIKYFVQVLKGKINITSPDLFNPVLQRPFIFDLPPPLTCA